MFELNKRYTLQAPKGTISERGIALIKQFITSQRLKDDHWQARNPDTERVYLTPLPDDWSYVWVITGRGEYVGTFPKRVSKYYHNTLSIKCPNEFLQELGNIARQHSEDNVSYDFDFVDKFRWNSGDFGDSGSCYWRSNSGARDVMENEGGYAIRFYKDDSGYGRAWLAKLADNQFIIFNGYGYTTLQIARVFAQFMGLSYKKTSLENHGHTNGLVWINSGTGYIIGSADSIATKYHHDLQWGKGVGCENCGDEIGEDDEYRTPNGELYCQDCFYEHCDYCYHCDETCWRDDMYYIESLGREVCESCLDRHYTRCDACEEYHHNDNGYSVQDEWYCESCFEDNAAYCDGCEDYYSTNHVTVVDTAAYCDDCLQDHTSHCVTCHETMHDCTCKR